MFYLGWICPLREGEMQCCLEKVESFKVFSARKKILELGDLTWHESVVSVTFTILVRNIFCDILLSNIFWDIQAKNIMIYFDAAGFILTLFFPSHLKWNNFRNIMNIFFSKWIILRRRIRWFSFSQVALWFFRDPDFMTGWAPAISPGGNGFVKVITSSLEEKNIESNVNDVLCHFNWC